MNQRILIFLIVVCAQAGYFISDANAQSQVEVKFGYGLSAVRESKQISNFTGNYEAGISMMVALGYEARHEQLLNVKFGLRYIQNNYKITGIYSEELGSSYVTGDFTLNTLDFSVYPEFIVLDKEITVVAGAGPYFGTILNSKVNGEMWDSTEVWYVESTSGPISGSASKYFLTRDVGLELVTGGEYEFSDGIKVLLEANLKLGLVNFSNAQLTYGYLKPVNFFLQVGVGYHFKDKNIREMIIDLLTFDRYR